MSTNPVYQEVICLSSDSEDEAVQVQHNNDNVDEDGDSELDEYHSKPLVASNESDGAEMQDDGEEDYDALLAEYGRMSEQLEEMRRRLNDEHQKRINLTKENLRLRRKTSESEKQIRDLQTEVKQLKSLVGNGEVNGNADSVVEGKTKMEKNRKRSDSGEVTNTNALSNQNGTVTKPEETVKNENHVNGDASKSEDVSNRGSETAEESQEFDDTTSSIEDTDLNGPEIGRRWTLRKRQKPIRFEPEGRLFFPSSSHSRRKLISPSSITKRKKSRRRPPRLPENELPENETHGIASLVNFRCTCGSQYRDKGVLMRHIRSKVMGKIYVCIICSKSFDRGDYLKYHYQGKHGVLYNRGRLGCWGCSETFSSIDEIEQHSQVARHATVNPSADEMNSA